MPARSHLVQTSLWGRRFRPLTPAAKLTMFYVLTCPHRRSEGIFEVSPAHISVDTGLEVVRVEQALQELHDAGMVLVDLDAELVLLPDALRLSPLRNGVNAKGDPVADKRIDPAVRHFEMLPDSMLKAEFVKIAEESSPDLAAAIKASLGDTYLPDVWKAPPEAPSEGPREGSSTGASTGASHAPIRDDASTSGEDAAGPPPPCHWCDKPAQVTAGVHQVGPGDLPWCGWCDTEVGAA